jgi:hypothetical protein
LFQLAEIKAGMNEMFMREGIEERFNKIRSLLKQYKGIKFEDDIYDTLDVEFQFAQPQNDKEIIENLKELRMLGGMSLESLLEKSPYTTDVRQEIERIQSEGNSAGNNTEVEEVES